MGEAFQRGIVRGFRRECVKQKENMRGKERKKKGLEGARKGHKVVGTPNNLCLERRRVQKWRIQPRRP